MHIPHKRPAGYFTRLAKWTARITGRPLTFAIVVLMVVGWAVSGPIFKYSDTWQLTINTGTTIVTFLMVFLIQNTQNRDAKAMQLKLNELIRATEGAHNALVSAEGLSDEALRDYVELYNKFAEESRKRSTRGRDDTAVIGLKGETAGSDNSK